MSSYRFGNRQVSIPGAYVNFRGSGNPETLPSDYGNILVLDTNRLNTKNFSVDCYVDESNIKAGIEKCTFKSLDSAREKIRGGLFWKLTELMFQPEINAPTISALTYQVLKGYSDPTVLANYYSATVAGSVAVGGSDLFDINITLKSRGAGVATSHYVTQDGVEYLQRGYQLSVKTSGDKFYFELYRSSYKDQNEIGDEYLASILESPPELVLRTKKFLNLGEFKAYADTDTAWNFFVKQYIITSRSSAAINSTYLNAVTTIVPSLSLPFTLGDGGLDTSTTTKEVLLEEIFKYINDKQYDAIFIESNLDDDSIVDDIKVLIGQTDHKPDLITFGGSDKYTFDFSCALSEALNSEDVILVHGGQKNFTYNNTGDSYYLGSIYQAAQVLGRIYGLPPYTPATFKTINTKGQKHTLDNEDKETAISKGVLAIAEYGNTQEILKGVNTLQNNRVLINADGTTPSIQIKRIKRQLSKESVAYFNALLRANPLGPTRSTLSEAFVLDKAKVFLNSKLAKPELGIPNLLLGYTNLSVTFVQDAFYLNFEGIVDNEVSFAFVSPLLTIKS